MIHARSSRLGASALIGLAAASLAGCASDPTQGYSFSSSHDTGIRTVHVPMFKNPTFQRGLEVDLTDAIIKEIQRSTPWKVAEEGVAETSLTGTITSSSLRHLTDNRDSGLAQEMSYTIVVDFDWIDARTGKPLVSLRSYSASDTFVPTQPVGERLDVGLHGAVDQLARDIVGEMRSRW